MDKTFEELARLVGKVLARRWLTSSERLKTRSVTPAERSAEGLSNIQAAPDKPDSRVLPDE